jgi:hypothetical protein
MGRRYFLFLFLNLIQHSWGFSAATVYTPRREHGISRKSSVQFLEQSLNSEDAVSSLKTVKYDLGLGKNRPVMGSSQPSARVTDDHDVHLHLTVSYLVDYESTREFPSPTRIPLASAGEGPRKSRKRQYAPLVPKRITDDSIISIASNGQATARKFRGHFDLNTAWIEMLIHEEQNKLKTAAVISR